METISVHPTYLALHQNGELHKRAKKLRRILSKCKLCAHGCGVNRIKEEKGFCRASAQTVYNSAMPHHGEERVLSGYKGSGTVFFSFCNSRCIFCQNYDISQFHRGGPISDQKLAEVYLLLQKQGCHNVNFVSPAHFLPSIIKALAIAVDEGFSLPLVYNSNGYDRVEILKILDGIIDIYLPDMKFGNRRIGWRLSRMLEYPEVSKKAIAEMHRQVGLLETDEEGIARRGLIIRHLVLPNDLSFTSKVMKSIADIDKNIHVNLMRQYRPAFRADYERGLNRPLSKAEYENAAEAAEKAGLVNVWLQNVL